MTKRAGERFRMGIVHGRFQPFHLEHLEYVMSAVNRCDELVIGISNPDAGQLLPAGESNHRHLPESNPYSFFHRLLMVQGSLQDAGVELSKVSVVPFHVFEPKQWQHYLPRPYESTHLVRVFSEWEERKISALRDYGFRVVQIDHGCRKSITATRVRELIATGGAWRALVPQATTRVIDDMRRSGREVLS